MPSSPNTEVPPGSPAPAVRLSGLRKEFSGRPPVVAVDDADLSIASGEFFSMLGPSGSGKTTVLRMIAGFEQPTSGSIELAGEDVTGRPPYARDVNTVFQDYAIFPHMNVPAERGVRPAGEEGRQGRAPPARPGGARAGAPRRLGDRRPTPALRWAAAARRARPRAGQPARACCCSTSPSAPSTSSCASRCRSSSRRSSARSASPSCSSPTTRRRRSPSATGSRSSTTGRIEQVGTAREIYEQPANAFVAGFVGTSNLLRGEQAERATGPRGHLRHPAREARPSSPRDRSAATATARAPGTVCRGRVRRPGDPLRGRPRRRGRLIALEENGHRGHATTSCGRGRPRGAGLAPRAPHRGPRAHDRTTDSRRDHPSHKGVPSETRR